MPKPRARTWQEGVLYLPDPEPRLLARALLSAGAQRLHHHLEVMEERLRHPDARVRVAAASALLNGLRAPGAEALVLGLLLEDPAPEVRQGAAAQIFAWALSHPERWPRVQPELRRAASADPDEAVRASALRCLRGLGGLDPPP
ncbi:MAG: HEAT repeat domain-containing protein [Alphaproteobacteria bacterium]|nr:HEAT repeat domain-containing protein [Alphaproteobacteria bacterium]